MTDKFKLGNKLHDKVTGLEGIAVGRNHWLNGCIQYCIKPPLHEGKVLDGEWVDENQLELIDEGILVKQKETGGPNKDAPKA